MGVEEGTRRAVAAKKTRVQVVPSSFPRRVYKLISSTISLTQQGPGYETRGCLVTNLHCLYLKATHYLFLMLQVKWGTEMLRVGLWPMFYNEAAEIPTGFYYQQNCCELETARQQQLKLGLITHCRNICISKCTFHELKLNENLMNRTSRHNTMQNNNLFI